MLSNIHHLVVYRTHNFFFYVFYFVLLGLLALLFIVMAHTLIGLNFEGSHWFFEILSQHKLVYAAGEWRWTDTLWQLPAYISLNWLPWIPFRWNLHLLSYSYTLFPFAGVLLSYLVIRREKNVFLYMTFPLLSLASAAAISLAFVVGISNGTITFFWPLFFILIFKNLDNIKYFLSATALLFLLSFNYDLAIIFFPLLIIAILQKCHFRPGTYERVFMSLILLSFLFQVYRLIDRHSYAPNDMFVFWESLFKQTQSSYVYIFQLAVLMTFFAGLKLFFKFDKPAVLWGSVFICGLIGGFWYYRDGVFTLFEARQNRTASVFLAWIIAAGLFYFKKFLDKSDGHVLRRYIMCCSFVCILMSFVFNFYCLRKWNNYRSSVLSVLHEEKGCIFVDQKSQIKNNAFMSLLLQKTKSPQSILLTSDQACAEEYTDPCQQYVSQKYPEFKCRYLHLTGYKMDLSATQTQTKTKAGPIVLTY